MAKIHALCALAALCFLLPFHVSYADDSFTVEGKIYCDTCRAGFETNAIYYIPGAKVKLECLNKEDNKITVTKEVVTDNNGAYKIEVVGDHQEEVCEVVLLGSPIPTCNEIESGRNWARIMLTSNSGIVSNTRLANPLGFLKAEPLQICTELLKLLNASDDN